MHKIFPNPNNNEWLNKYNELVSEIKSKEDYFKEYKKTQPKRNDKEKKYDKNNVGIHHIIPKKVDMSLINDKDNLLYVPFDKHYFIALLSLESRLSLCRSFQIYSCCSKMLENL